MGFPAVSIVQISGMLRSPHSFRLFSIPLQGSVSLWSSALIIDLLVEISSIWCLEPYDIPAGHRAPKAGRTVRLAVPASAGLPFGISRCGSNLQALPAFDTVQVGKSPPGDHPGRPDIAQPQAALQTLGGQASVGSEVGTEGILLRSCRNCNCILQQPAGSR